MYVIYLHFLDDKYIETYFIPNLKFGKQLAALLMINTGEENWEHFNEDGNEEWITQGEKSGNNISLSLKKFDAEEEYQNSKERYFFLHEKYGISSPKRRRSPPIKARIVSSPSHKRRRPSSRSPSQSPTPKRKKRNSPINLRKYAREELEKKHKKELERFEKEFDR